MSRDIFLHLDHVAQSPIQSGLSVSQALGWWLHSHLHEFPPCPTPCTPKGTCLCVSLSPRWCFLGTTTAFRDVGCFQIRARHVNHGTACPGMDLLEIRMLSYWFKLGYVLYLDTLPNNLHCISLLYLLIHLLVSDGKAYLLFHNSEKTIFLLALYFGTWNSKFSVILCLSLHNHSFLDLDHPLCTPVSASNLQLQICYLVRVCRHTHGRVLRT